MVMSAEPHLDYFLTIGDTSCTTSAWWCVNAGILRDSSPRRGDDVVLAGVDGVLWRRRFRDSRTLDLQFIFDGAADADGEEHDDPAVGLLINLDNFKTSVVEVSDAQQLELETPNGTYSGDCIVTGSGLVTGPGLTRCAATLTITLPDGRLLLQGS